MTDTLLISHWDSLRPPALRIRVMVVLWRCISWGSVRGVGLTAGEFSVRTTVGNWCRGVDRRIRYIGQFHENVSHPAGASPPSEGSLELRMTDTDTMSHTTHQFSVIFKQRRQLRTSSSVEARSLAPVPSLLPPQTPMSKTIAAENAGMQI
jgi:hypothetical protein